MHKKSNVLNKNTVRSSLESGSGGCGVELRVPLAQGGGPVHGSCEQEPLKFIHSGSLEIDMLTELQI